MTMWHTIGLIVAVLLGGYLTLAAAVIVAVSLLGWDRPALDLDTEDRPEGGEWEL